MKDVKDVINALGEELGEIPSFPVKPGRKPSSERVPNSGVQKGWKYDSEKALEKKLKAIDDSLMERSMAGNTNALKIYYQRLGLLTEKTEVKIGLSADEIARRNLDARRELEGQGYVRGEEGQGVEKVQDESSLLHDQLCLDSGQGEAGDSEVGGVASST